MIDIYYAMKIILLSKCIENWGELYHLLSGMNTSIIDRTWILQLKIFKLLLQKDVKNQEEYHCQCSGMNTRITKRIELLYILHKYIAKHFTIETLDYITFYYRNSFKIRRKGNCQCARINASINDKI